MEFRILGPLEVVEDGETLDLGPRKQRSLLALLLIHANRVVSTDRILEELWGDESEGKENALWVYVSRLRTVLEPDRDQHTVLVTKDHGYVLTAAPGSIDAVRFERETSRARELAKDDPTAGSTLFREALDLWRGTPFQEFMYDDFAQTEITRLQELRLAALEDAIEADLRRGLSGELVSELEVLHREHPLRERPVDQLMLALYRSGRSADALRTFERFRRGVGEELGIDPSPELCRLEEQILLHDSRLQPRRPTAVARGTAHDLINPFKGLRPFQEDDAGDFFGRDRLVSEVVRHVADGERLISLVGPSGSGKSSAVRAGLIPALRKGAVPGSDQWRFAYMLPGSDPFIELEAALLRSSIDAPDSLTEQLRGDDSGLLRAALRLLPDEESRLVLVIDQFEELFTLVADETVRQRFLDHLLVAADDAYGRVVVVITLRADFYGRPLEYPAFGERLGSGVVNVVPLSSDELEAAAMEPARRSGVTFEPALLAEVLTDVIGQPGALPMFQYTLTELFDRRVGNVLTINTFRAMGGVRGALTRRADDLYDQLDADEKEAAEQLLLRLVAITDHNEWSRRRVHASEIVALDVDVVAMQGVIAVFGGHRLLSFDRDQVSGAPTVEVAHEALLHEWDRLREWIEVNREDLLQHRELADAASRWNGAGRDQDYLYTGGRLDEYVQWSETSTMKLTARERDFLEAGMSKRRIDDDADEARRIREQQLQRSTRRRTWGLVAAVLVLVVGAMGVLWAVTRSEGPKIALIQESEGVVQAFIEQAWNQADRELRFEPERVVTLIDPEEDMRALAAAGYELIIDGTFDEGKTAYAVAPDFPDVSFVVFDYKEPALDNVTAIHFVREGGAYLMGVAAALESETGKIGFIGGMQAATTESRRASFTAGVRSIQPDIVVESVYLGPYHIARNAYLDYGLARATAEDLYRSGVDVIHHSVGTASLGIVAAAEELTDELGRELWVIGSEVEEQRLVPPEQEDRFLTSMWKRWDHAVYEAIEAYLDGELESGLLEIGLDQGAVDYSTEGRLSHAHAARLDAIRASIVAGDIDPRVAATEPPQWTREPIVTAMLVFDGVTCSSDLGPVELARGDVVVVNLVNDSKVDVGIAFETPEDYIPAAMTTFTAPGSRNAAAMRLLPGTYSVSCFTADRGYEGTTFTVVFETTCEGPTVDSDDPADVIRAYIDAANVRDADAVCSLFAEEAVVIDWNGRPDWKAEGNRAIAGMVTPLDDDLWIKELAVTDIEVSGNVVIWDSELRSIEGTSSTTGHRSIVENGKIIRWEWGGS